MDSTGSYILNNLRIDSQVERDNEDNSRTVWQSDAYMRGRQLPWYAPEYGDYCRQLFKFHVAGKPFILKVDRDMDFQQCPNEIDLWNKITKKDKRYFVPIVCSGTANPDWVVCPFLTLTVTTPKDWMYSLIHRISDDYNLHDLKPNTNWFVYYNQPIIVDYGVTEDM